MDFYKTVVGLEEVYFRPPVMAGFLSNGNTHHDVGLVDFHGPAGWRKECGLNHLGIELETEVDLLDGYRRAVADDFRFQRTADHDIAHSVYCLDPDGNQIEIYADVTKNWRTQRTGMVMAPTIKWTPGVTPPLSEPQYVAKPELRRIEAAIWHPLKVTHVALIVSQFEVCLEHYLRVVGMRVLFGGADAPFAVLGGTCGERSISLFRAGLGRKAGLHHVGFVLRDEADLEDSKARMRKAGLPIEVDIDHPARRCVHINDPDDIRLQFYVDRVPSVESLRDIDEGLALYLA
jgi:catechol 2,3-dioxygenase